jgi:hypothetical protein
MGRGGARANKNTRKASRLPGFTWRNPCRFGAYWLRCSGWAVAEVAMFAKAVLSDEASDAS